MYKSKPDPLYPCMQGSNEMIMTVFLITMAYFNVFIDVGIPQANLTSSTLYNPSAFIYVQLVYEKRNNKRRHGHYTNLVSTLSRALGAPHFPLAVFPHRTVCHPQ